MINVKIWDVITWEEDQYTIHIENLYDKSIKDDLYESDGEKFVIYINRINIKEFEISNATYVDNLLTKKNKYNIEVVPPNSTGVIILNVNSIKGENYKFTMCKSKEIKFTIDSSNGNFASYDQEYPFPKISKENGVSYFKKQRDFKNEILIHSFKSDSEFLFSYSFILLINIFLILFIIILYIQFL